MSGIRMHQAEPEAYYPAICYVYAQHSQTLSLCQSECYKCYLIFVKPAEKASKRYYYYTVSQKTSHLWLATSLMQVNGF